MGHQTVLIIGDYFRDQPSKYQFAERAPITNRHLVAVGYLEEASSLSDGEQNQCVKHCSI